MLFFKFNYLLFLIFDKNRALDLFLPFQIIQHYHCTAAVDPKKSPHKLLIPLITGNYNSLRLSKLTIWYIFEPGDFTTFPIDHIKAP